jgi:hypothetical protein
MIVTIFVALSVPLMLVLLTLACVSGPPPKPAKVQRIDGRHLRAIDHV